MLLCISHHCRCSRSLHASILGFSLQACQFKIQWTKRKRFKLNLEIFKDIFKIFPRVEGQDFDALSIDEEIVCFLRELGHTKEINSLNDVVVDQMHQPWRTFAALINRILSGKTTGLDKLRVSRAQIIWGMYHQKNVDYVELLWEDFIYQIDNKAYKKQEKMYYPLFTKVIIYYFLTQDKAVSWRNKIEMHTSKDYYLINTITFVSTKEATQIYGVVLPESLASPEMKETKAYKTYLGFATGATPPKKARKFKKPASPQLSIVPVLPKEPTGKLKIVNRPTKKSTKAPTRGVVIRETPEMPLSKKKEKMTVEKRKGINLLSKVALTKEAQYEEVRRKSLRDFHKTHPSGSGTVTKTAPSAAKISLLLQMKELGNDEDDSNNDHDSSGEDNDQENDRDDEEEVKDEFVKTPSNDSDDEDETKITDKAEGDEDEEIDYTTSTDSELTNIQQGNENPEISQVIEDAHVTLSTIPQKTEVLVTSSSHLFDLASKFLNFSDIPHTNEEIVSPMDVHIHHEVPSQQTPTLLTVHIFVITDSSLVYSTVIPQSLPSFTPPPQQSTSTPPTTKSIRLGATEMNYELHFWFLLLSITARITKHVKNQLPQILPKEVSNFAPPVIQSMVTESLEHAVLAKESYQPQSSYEAAASLTKFVLKKILIDKMDKSESYLAATPLMSGSSKDTKSQPKSSGKTIQLEEPEFEVADSDMPQDQEGNLGNNDDEPKKETVSKRDWFTKPTQP
ncbi:hypothetical protein Tco_1274096 [Tanacetum coccineum]